MNLNPIYLLLLLGLACLGCKEKTVKAPDPREATDSLHIKVTDSLTKQAQLQEKAQAKVKSIEGYPVLENGLQELNGMTIAETKAHVEEWVDATLKLQLALLDSVQNRAINSRMSLLRTKASILRQEVEKRKIDTAIINKEATEFYNAFQDLSIQLNREYGSSVDEFLKQFQEESLKLKQEAQKRRAQEQSDTL